MKSTIQVCSRCVLDTSVPGTIFDEQGECNHCKEFDTYRESLFDYFGAEDQLPAKLEEWVSGRDTSDYQALLLFSGGKDSTYALSRLVDFGVKVLACVFDNDYLAPVALKNAETVCREIGVDCHALKTDKIKEIFRESLKTEHH